MASRIAVVREAVGLAAYAVGDWTTAIAELRTYHRMTGRQTHLAELADCERALGRPERAIDLFRGADKDTLDKAGAIELLIVAAGARGDLGQHDAAVAMLQVRELTADEDAEWAVRLRYAYADALLAAGRRDEAREWFARAAAADEDNLTDAAERLLELDGVTIEGDDPEDEDEAGDNPVAVTGDSAGNDDEEDDDAPRAGAAAGEAEDDHAPAARIAAEDADPAPAARATADEDDEDAHRAPTTLGAGSAALTDGDDEVPVAADADDEGEEYRAEAFDDDDEDDDLEADLVDDVDAGIDSPEGELTEAKAADIGEVAFEAQAGDVKVTDDVTDAGSERSAKGDQGPEA
jgi:tetratricopeptide (TPR) repeat protein